MYHNYTLIMSSCETTSYCFHKCYTWPCTDSNFLPCLKNTWIILGWLDAPVYYFMQWQRVFFETWFFLNDTKISFQFYHIIFVILRRNQKDRFCCKQVILELKFWYQFISMHVKDGQLNLIISLINIYYIKNRDW